MPMNYVFVETCVDGDLCKAKALHKQGADIHAYDDAGLRGAARYGHLSVVKYLVEQGADIHANDDAGLRGAAEKGHLNTVKYLVEQGANIHAWDDQALTRAAECGHPDVVNFLREAATGEIVEKPGETDKKLTVKVRKFPRARGK